jgi:hypothetical protein
MLLRAGDQSEPLIDIDTLRIDWPVRVTIEFDRQHPVGKMFAWEKHGANSLWGRLEVLGREDLALYPYLAVSVVIPARSMVKRDGRRVAFGAGLREVALTAANSDLGITPWTLLGEPDV